MKSTRFKLPLAITDKQPKLNHMEKVYIVGVGDDGLSGLSQTGQNVVSQASILVGSIQSLGGIPESSAQRFVVRDDIEQVVKIINENPSERIVILVTGDPLFYGTTRFLYEKVGKDRFEIVPHVSIMQLAFARVKENWDEAILADLSNKPIEQLLDKIRTAEKVGLFTSQASTPARICGNADRTQSEIILKHTFAKILLRLTNESRKPNSMNSLTTSSVR